MNTADIIFALIVITGGVLGYYAGGIRVLLEMIKWLVIIFFGWWWYRFLYQQMGSRDELFREPVWLVIFLSGNLMVLMMINFIQRLFIRSAGVTILQSRMNKFLGAGAGLAAGAFAVFILWQGMLVSRDAFYTREGETSVLYPLLNNYSGSYPGKLQQAKQQIRAFLPVSANEETTPSGRISSRPDLEYKMLQWVNEERKKAGLDPLTGDEAMRKVGRAHALDMLNRNYFSHSTPEGMDPFQRMKKAGIRFHFAGENLAAAPTLEQAHAGLMHSPHHRAAILSKDFKRVGIAVIDGGSRGLMVAQEFRD